MKNAVLLCLALLPDFCCPSAHANNITISNVTLTGATASSVLVQFDLSWDNSWRLSAAPATGLLVFDTNTGSFWFYTGSAWTNLVGVVERHCYR